MPAFQCHSIDQQVVYYVDMIAKKAQMRMSIKLDNYYRTTPFNAQCRSKPLNADQNHGIDPKCLSMPIIADQCQSIPINSSQCPSMPDQA